MTALKKVQAVFYRTEQGAEPVHDLIRSLSREDRRAIGDDIATVEYGWPVGKPTSAPLGMGLWEGRSSLTTRRIARVIFMVEEGQTVLLHGFIKKTQRTAQSELELACRRMKEIRR